MSTLKEVQANALETRDTLDDVLHGFVLWRDSKVGSGELTDKDEQFLRWIEASPAKELLQ